MIITKRTRCISLGVATFLFLSVSNVWACRFWGAVGEAIPEKIITEHLLEAPHSLKVLGHDYSDGWSIGYYENEEAIVFRRSRSSIEDDHFDRAVKDVAEMQPNIVFGHLRKASSGCVDGVPNPHPFDRIKNGKTWLFGHNGGMNKQIMIDLIGEYYLENNPPLTCPENPPNSWVDSELYFLFLLKNIETQEWNVERGLVKALKSLYDALEDENRYLNFFLTDGTTMWSFRKGNSLHYFTDEKHQLSVISSTVPVILADSWKSFPEDQILVLRAKQPPKFVSVIDSP